MLRIARLALIALLLVAGSAAAQTVADLRVTNSGPTQLLPGVQYQWTITIDNAGSAAANGATFNGTIPNNVVNPSTQCTATGRAACGPINVVVGSFGGTLDGAIPTLPPGGRITIVVTATSPLLLVSIVPIFPPMVTSATCSHRRA